MKTALILTFLCTAAVSFAAAQEAAPSKKMTDAERAKAVQMLKDTRKEFLDDVESLSDAQWNFKPAPVEGRDRWSIAQCAEHIMLAEATIFGRVEAALAAPENPDWQTKTAKKTELLMRVLPDRSGKATAPEVIQPKSNLSRAEIMKRYKELREAHIKFAETTDADLKSHTQDNPFPLFGTLNAYQWLIYVPLHNNRHDQQIQEVKTYPGYPAK